MTEKTTVYIIECRTGCTCCSGENHYRGPFSTIHMAKHAETLLRESGIIGSQYAPSGVFTISEMSCERLPDGRLIIGGDRVVSGFADDFPLEPAAVYEL
jgi:hypothetical protein